jgi:uroporphyrinogen decarboxylase
MTSELPPFLAACRGERPRWTPVWFMRQAGRSLPEYRALRADVGMLQACTTPELVAEITLQPVRRHGVDAAILFSDIVLPLHAIGIDLQIEAGVGPVIAEPVRSAADLDRFRLPDEGDFEPVAQAVRILAAESPVPVIGFAGAPFTLASYLIEGGPSRHHERTKALLYSDPGLFGELLGRLAAISGAFLAEQVRHGVAAVQLFDSWVGALSVADYRRHVLPHSVAALRQAAGVPRIHFGVGTGELLAAMAEQEVEVIGVDYRVGLAEAARRCPGRVVQGNLDPAALFASPEALTGRVAAVLADAASAEAPGHIFNLGHGVLPQTDPDRITQVVAQVHEATERTGAMSG